MGHRYRYRYCRKSGSACVQPVARSRAHFARSRRSLSKFERSSSTLATISRRRPRWMLRHGVPGNVPCLPPFWRGQRDGDDSDGGDGNPRPRGGGGANDVDAIDAPTSPSA
eukprot:scaffold109783_cov68-Phaeocystis_antarctica.AAC.1